MSYHSHPHRFIPNSIIRDISGFNVIIEVDRHMISNVLSLTWKNTAVVADDISLWVSRQVEETVTALAKGS